MPLVYQHTINNHTKLGFWHIQEEEEFFLQKVPLHNKVTHPHKRLQHLAGRYLLPILFNDFPLEEIVIADTRKPFIPDDAYHFSISHCGDYAAAIVSQTERVGIDIEQPTEKIFKIAHKFLNSSETELLNQHKSGRQLLALTTLFWSAKEAIFKWYSLGGVDFRQHMQLLHIEGTEEEGTIFATFQKDKVFTLRLRYCFFKGLIVCWTTEESSLAPSTNMLL